MNYKEQLTLYNKIVNLIEKGGTPYSIYSETMLGAIEDNPGYRSSVFHYTIEKKFSCYTDGDDHKPISTDQALTDIYNNCRPIVWNLNLKELL